MKKPRNKKFKTAKAAQKYAQLARAKGYQTYVAWGAHSKYMVRVFGKPVTNPGISKLRKGIRGTVKLVGTGKSRRLEIRT